MGGCSRIIDERCLKLDKPLRSREIVFIFDLDNTLYSEKSGLLSCLDRRINAFLEDRLAMERDAVDRLRKRYVEKYGTTLRGVQLNHGIDPRDYIAYTHAIDVRRFLRPEEDVLFALRALPGAKVVFSNSPQMHADSVIDALGLAGVFERVYTIEFCEYDGKPGRRAYEKVLDDLGVSGDRCVMVEDTARNLSVPHQMGMTTVLVADGLLHRPHCVDYVVTRLPDLLEIKRWSAAS